MFLAEGNGYFLAAAPVRSSCHTVRRLFRVSLQVGFPVAASRRALVCPGERGSSGPPLGLASAHPVKMELGSARPSNKTHTPGWRFFFFFCQPSSKFPSLGRQERIYKTSRDVKYCPLSFHPKFGFYQWADFGLLLALPVW